MAIQKPKCRVCGERHWARDPHVLARDTVSKPRTPGREVTATGAICAVCPKPAVGKSKYCSSTCRGKMSRDRRKSGR